MQFKTLSEIWSYYDVKERKHFDAHDICKALGYVVEETEHTALLRRVVKGSIGQRPIVPGAVEISNNSAELNSRGN